MARSTVDKKYLLRPDAPAESAYYQIRQHGDGWLWIWSEAGESEDVGPLCPTRAEALFSAADDAEECIGDYLGGKRLANRLRAAARAVAA